MKKYIALFIAFSIVQTFVFSQNDEVNECLNMVSEGRTDEAKIKIPELLAKFPGDAGVKFLHAVVLEDGSLAIGIYKDIISKYPKSEWADDAYLRIIQYYAITGDTAEAQKYLKEFKKNFPNSEYTAFAVNAVNVSVNQQRKNDIREVLSDIVTDVKETEAESAKPESENKSEMEKIPDKEQIPAGNFTLQVGIYSTQTAAKNEALKYSKFRLVANTMPKKIGNETMYAVVIGEYKTKQMAENAKPLVAKHCNCIPLIIEK